MDGWEDAGVSYVSYTNSATGSVLSTGTGNGQGSNSVNLRLFNERVILNALRRMGQASKADLSRSVNLTSNTAGVIVKELEERGLIRSEGKRSGARGQPATLLSLNPEGAYSIGVKVGRRSVDTLLVDFRGHVVERRHHERDFPMPEESLALALGDIAEMRAMLPAGARDRMAGIGVAAPYNMGSWRRELDIRVEDYKVWNDVDIAAQLGEATGLPVFRENDGTAAAVAEMFRGCGRELQSFVYLFIGSAIGGGLVMNGEYYRGVTGNAGDIGLMPVGASRLATAPAPTHSCDILLTRASINSLIRHLRGNGVDITMRSELERAIPQHPTLVGEWLDDAAEALVMPLLSASCLLDVEAIVIDGDLPMDIRRDLESRLNRNLDEAVPEARRPPPLRLGQVGRQAAALGAAILPLHLNYSPSREILVNQ
ncbi:ROK family transcriptional regulator [Azospirillum griseum]|uniref:ROK family protein n=1 Tax=Azospirillum griseum TaxID=2496639 RepID=A0A3S0I0U9_9PROT|nr:ROK family transcriptional regulator [Azospirillum griseum]RTR20264.1 ROK family protein [Azospirillum griseum]